jgi:hypothetical protein
MAIPTRGLRFHPAILLRGFATYNIIICIVLFRLAPPLQSARGGEHVAIKAEGHGKGLAGVARHSLPEEETERCTTLEFDVGGPAVL